MPLSHETARMLADARRKLEQLEAGFGDATRTLGRMSTLDPTEFSLDALMATIEDIRDLLPKIAAAERDVNELRAQVL